MMELIFELIVLTFLTEKVYVYVSMMLASQGNRVRVTCLHLVLFTHTSTKCQSTKCERYLTAGLP